MELEFIDWLRGEIRSSSQVPLGPGDDAALIQFTPGHQCVATVDTIIDQVDFLSAETSPASIGRKALAINLSDLAAMGAKPVAALVSIAFARNQDITFAKEVYRGLLTLAKDFNCSIAGGDTTVYDGPLSINITCLGEVLPGKAFLRSGAKPGDALLVTGQLGGSILGHHLHFTPRITEAQWLSQHAQISAAMDLSDGLGLDASRLAKESNCGIIIDLAALPVSAAAKKLATQSPTHKHATAFTQFSTATTERLHAFSDGEDFELLLAVSPPEADRLLSLQPLSVPLTRIGTFCAQPGLWATDSAGNLRSLPAKGYVHGENA